jgi:hypothetical protein
VSYASFFSQKRDFTDPGDDGEEPVEEIGGNSIVFSIYPLSIAAYH